MYMKPEKLIELGGDPENIPKEKSTITKEDIKKRCDDLMKKKKKKAEKRKQSIKRSTKKNRTGSKKKNYKQYLQKAKKPSRRTADSIPV